MSDSMRRRPRHCPHGAFNHTRNNHRTATTTIPDACNEFHRYQMTWSANRITVGVDDRNYYQYSNDGSGNAEWPFDSRNS
jgi:beta-glucanase (GH16 family)